MRTGDAEADRLRFHDSVAGDAAVALGLPAGRLALVGGTVLAGWVVARSGLPSALGGTLAGSLLLVGASLAWGRAYGVSLGRWAWLALGFAWRLLQWRGCPAWTPIDQGR